jgi:16S rRNA G966 N2-methylase RsmD
MTEAVTIKTVQPISRAFPAEKAKAWHYKIHPYYTKQPSNVVGEYIRHFCPEGGLVVDPFCGSGVTAIEALTNRRRTVCLDLDPLAVFITRQTCLAPVDLNAFWDAYRQIEEEIWPIVNFVRGASSKELRDYKLKEWYPKGVKLPSNADRGYVEDLFDKAHLICLAHLRAAIMKINEIQIRNLMLFVFSGILHRASITNRYHENPAGRLWDDSGIFLVYRYWVPAKKWSRDTWELFSIRAKLVANAKKKSNILFGDFVREGETFNVYCDSAENLLKYVDKDTVDYIYTDPPYGAHISYLDLGTMWHAWLGLDVTDEMRAREAIEGGEQQFDEKHYLDVLGKSFEQMFYALKDEAWLSLVFHHKETNLWYQIRDMLRYIGFTYVNTVAQPLSWRSFHKFKNPLRVLGESLIVNFQKSTTRKISQPMSLPMANIIQNVAERVILEGGGATTEEILREVVPELFDNDMFFDAASQKIGDILAILESDFEMGEDNLWRIKAERQIGNFIPPRLRIQYYVIGYLRKVGKAKFDDIVINIFPRLTNGHRPTKADIADVLNEIAVSHDNVNWELKDPSTLAVQGVLQTFISEKEPEYTAEIPESTTHNQQIYRLAIMCQKAGLVPYIGKKERHDPMLAALKPLTYLNIKADAAQQRRIEGIDIIWAGADATPVWAFEIEESTSILSALERFVALLSAAPELGNRRQLTIVAPKARRRKVFQELTSSSYIGHPQYLENKINYIFYDDLTTAFNKYSARRTINLEEIHRLCHLPPPADEYKPRKLF